jgi:small GTP-binding protein
MSEPVGLKFVVIGESGAGKTALIRRLADDQFVSTASSTLGAEFYTHDLALREQTVRLLLWDTAGQERFYSVAKAYFRSALGVVLVYDICDRRGYDQLRRWLRDARLEADPNCTVLLIGNKLDLAASRVVPATEAEEFARAHDLLYEEASAADGTNVRDAFVRIATDVWQKALRGEVSVVAPGPGGAAVLVQPKKSALCCG